MLRVARNDAERNNITFKALDVVRQYALKFFKTGESGVDKVVSSCEKSPSVHWRYMNFLRQRKTALDAPLYAVSAGRSMIEMLSVLAIVGVLSVGGIAGYSKAMEQYKINKATEEYVYLMYGLLEYLPEFQKNSKDQDNDNDRLVDFVIAAKLVPPTWKQLTNRALLDAYGNNLNIFSRNNRLVVDLFLGAQTNAGENGSVSINFPSKLCVQLFENLAIPLKESLYNAYYIHNPGTAYIFYGDNYCSKGRNCLNTLSLSRINELCSYCPADKSCGIIFEF